MNSSQFLLCAICGQVRHHGPGWYLLLEDSWRDRLKILRWNPVLAQHPAVRCACSILHVRELVAHWMATGSLDYPFASASAFEGWIDKCLDRNLGGEAPVTSTGKQVLGELAIDRASLRNALRDNTHLLSSTLEALLSALEIDESPSTPPNVETGELVLA